MPSHNASQWQVDLATGDWSAPLYDSGWDVANLMLSTIEDLPINVPLKARVRYRDSAMAVGEWSNELTFTICNGGWRVTFFQIDDLTPILGVASAIGDVVEASFHTGIGCPRSYMKHPQDVSEVEVDFLEGSASISGMLVEVIDKRSVPSDQSTGQVTAILSQLSDARVVVEYWQDDRYVVAMDGVTSRIGFDSGKIVTAKFSLRDTRERERKFPVFTKHETYAVFPPGPVLPYGRRPDGTYLVAASIPFRGKFYRHDSPAAGEEHGIISIAMSVGELTDAQLIAGNPVMTEETDAAGVKIARYSNAVVRWRLVGGAWTELRNMKAGLRAQNDIPRHLFARLYGEMTPALRHQAFNFLIGALVYIRGTDVEVPAHGAIIEVQVIARIAPSPETPLFWEGTFGQLLKDMEDGVWSERAPRTQYNQAWMDNEVLNSPIARLRKDKPEQDMRSWLQQHWFKPRGMVPALDEKGKLFGISYSFPTDLGVALPELNSDNTKLEGSDWEAEPAKAVSDIEFTYQRESLISIKAGDDLPEGGVWVGPQKALISRDVVVRYGVAGDQGDESIVYAPETVRDIGAPDGKPISPDLLDETGSLMAGQRASDLLHRLPYGAYQLPVLCRGSDAVVKARQVGDWIQVALPWIPNIYLNLRGGIRYGQIVSKRPPIDGWTGFRLLDGGPVLAALAVPVADAPELTVEGEISVRFTGVPADSGAALYYVWAKDTDPEPTTGWAFAGQVVAAELPKPVLTRVAPADKLNPFPRGWVRYRTEAVGRLSSAWVGPFEVPTVAVPRLIDLAVFVRYGDALVELEGNVNAGGARIFYDVHDVDVAPDLNASWIDTEVNAGARWALMLTSGVTESQVVSIRAVPYTEWAVETGVAGTAGPEAFAVASGAQVPNAFEVVDADGDEWRLDLAAGRTLQVVTWSGSLHYLDLDPVTWDLPITLADGTESLIPTVT